MINYKKVFKKWMKEIGFWKEYKKNFKKYKFKDVRFNDFLNETIPVYYISDSFSWKYTDEGRKFWLDLSELWEDYLEKIQ